MQYITTEVRGKVFLIGLNNPEQNNAFPVQMLMELSQAFMEYEDNNDLWCAVLFAHGKHFTVGLEMEGVSEFVLKNNGVKYPPNHVDPFGLVGRKRTKPLVTAMQGFCFTLGIELALASDIRICSKSTRFTQAEVQRGIAPFGGATFRMVEQFGWGNAMRYLLTGDIFNAEEALRVGLVQEITEAKSLLNRAVEIAETITKNAPLGIKLVLESAFGYRRAQEEEAYKKLEPILVDLMKSEDGKEGLQSFKENRKANFKGK
ncbi:crotonase/enoyl-CoA hydratase family protein [Leptospira sp. GIMC2001]|uniref:crotonase/enoyl-CoA hydratase family protein n=1 Tax=Leptospira sp. GIMC2001 TaxID=1513297 RepID=UPI002349012B|nr:crotonase/enoyl-CoA hydratase family protein [Leptospira sp. GIMC2001]WCL49710.1 crotonase/enoyl-CoA hydratase family protein [Leptospira sp. GIMC2001]